MDTGAGNALLKRLGAGALAALGTFILSSCSPAQGDQASASARTVATPATSKANELDTGSPARFFEALRGPLGSMGQCTAEQTRTDSQWTAKVELGLQPPLLGRLYIPSSPRLTEVMLVEGKAFVKGGQSEDDLWHLGDGTSVMQAIGEMDCRTVIDSLEQAAQSVEAGRPTTLRDKPAQTHEVTIDGAPWPTSNREQGSPSGHLGTMTLWVSEGQLSQLETDIGGARVTTAYTWFPGRPDVAAPPEDQISE
jgi:hypothetical protein